MFNFTEVKRRFELEAFDILRYEAEYYNDEDAFFYFKERMKKWVRDWWTLSKPDMAFFLENGTVRMKVQFYGDLPFGFEHAWDLEMIRRLKIRL